MKYYVTNRIKLSHLRIGGDGGHKLGILDIVTARRPHIQTAFKKGSYDLVVVCNDGTVMYYMYVRI